MAYFATQFILVTNDKSSQLTALAIRDSRTLSAFLVVERNAI